MTVLPAALFLAALSTSFSGGADAPADATEQVAPPHGYVVMCEKDRPLCDALAASNPGAVERDPARQWALVRAINHRVNETVRQVSDEVSVGAVETWRRTGLEKGAEGDCEDIAIEKRLQLIAAGFPAENLYFAVGYRTGLGLHAVLVAHTDRGEIVMDSRTAALASWQRAPYIWVSRQTPGAPAHWTDPSPLQTAATRSLASANEGTAALLGD